MLLLRDVSAQHKPADFSVVENRRVSSGKTVQRTVLYLGEINDRQQAAWRKTLDVFDETEQRFTSLSLFPEDRDLPPDVDLSPDLRQPVKSQNSSNGELTHGTDPKKVHEGVQAGRGAAA
jgi:hypothetical protein